MSSGVKKMEAKQFLTALYLQARKKKKHWPVVAELKGKRLAVTLVEANDKAEKIVIYLGD